MDLAYKTENAIFGAPGMIFCALDNGDMVTDRNSGEFLPIDQVLRDPLHIDQLDIFDEGKGCLKLGPVNETDDEEAGEEGGGSDEEGLGEAPPNFRLGNEDGGDGPDDDQDELAQLIAEQAADMALGKGRHTSFSNKDVDGHRHWAKRNSGQKPRNHIKFARKETLSAPAAN